MVDDLKEDKDINNRSQYDIDPSTRYSHFKNLNCMKDQFKERFQFIENTLSTIEKEYVCFNELHCRSETEISQALSNLDCKKSPARFV